MSSHAASSEAAAPRLARPGSFGRARSLALSAAAVDVYGAMLVAGILCLITFVAGGGLLLEYTDNPVKVEIGLTLVGGAVIAGTIALPRARSGASGDVATILMLALAGLTALSVTWSVMPDVSWQEASLTLAYAATFIAALRLARAMPERWPSLLGGVLLAGAVVCTYALATKVFPAALAVSEVHSRLEAPFGYWNATGLAAAMTVPPALWLGSRRAGHGAVNALAYPILGLALVTLLLSYSRGALLALGIGLIVYFTAVPLRLRSAVVLLTSAACAGAVVAWVFEQYALTHDNVALAQRSSSGHQLGILLLALVAVLLLAGLSIGFRSALRAPSPYRRRQAGKTLLGLLALVPVVILLALTASSRGLTGSISNGFHDLTSTTVPTPSNTPSRLTAVASVRALYWQEAGEVWQAHPLLGTGAGGYATARLRLHSADQQDTVQDAHSYVMQTLADLGIVGLGVSLALLVAWLVAALRAARPWGLGARRWTLGGRPWGLGPRRSAVVAATAADGGRYSAERIGLLTLFSVAVVFGVHSLIDWTWFIPGVACVGLMCAGWLAGRGPTAAPAPVTARRRAVARASTPRIGAAALVVALALVGAWAQWQPLRANDAYNAAVEAVNDGHYATALADAQSSVSLDPLSAQSQLWLGEVQGLLGETGAERATLQRAVSLEPGNPDTWVTLAGFYDDQNEPRAAVAALGSAVYLEPLSDKIHQEYLAALEEEGHPTPSSAIR